MNTVFIIPTGIGCEIGGHAGDATPAAKLIASLCDHLIIHPNVVNASNFNEMSPNMLYVEGSTLDDFLAGDIDLKTVDYNRILLVANPPLKPDLMNTISVARAVMGIDVMVKELRVPLLMEGFIENGIATGTYSGAEELIDQVQRYDYDALAIASEIRVNEGVALDYFRNGGVNPWGGIEAIVSRKIASALRKPVAHGPIESETTMNDQEILFLPYNEIVDPRMSAEAISTSYIYCLFKGLLRAPRIVSEGDLSWRDIDYLISPHGCIGRPHRLCMEKGIPIIVVEENKTVLNEGVPEGAIVVGNYLEAAGIITARKAGIVPGSIRRPIVALPSGLQE